VDELNLSPGNLAKAEKIIAHDDPEIITAINNGHMTLDQGVELVDMANEPTVESILAKFVDAMQGPTCVTTRGMVRLAMGDAFLTPEEHEFLMAGEWRMSWLEEVLRELAMQEIREKLVPMTDDELSEAASVCLQSLAECKDADDRHGYARTLAIFDEIRAEHHRRNS
jgi:hypothetical protein